MISWNIEKEIVIKAFAVAPWVMLAYKLDDIITAIALVAK